MPAVALQQPFPDLPQVEPTRHAIDTDPIVLDVRGITLVAGNDTSRQPLEVLRRISFQVPRSATLALVGESGAGKSMIGKVLARQLPQGFAVSEGSIRFGDHDLLAIDAAEHRRMLGRRLAFIPQEPMTALNPVLTIGQQFIEHLQRNGLDARAARTRALQMLEEVRLPDPVAIMDRYAFQLSGGQCQRVMIAMAFATDPDLVISDEATTALDASTQAHVVTLIRRLQQRCGTSVIFVTHDLGLAAQVADKLVVLYAGETMETGPARHILNQPLHPYTQALQRANPELTGPRRRLFSLPGQMPGLSEFPSLPGCRFASRCAVTDERCQRGVPAMVDVDEGRRVRCIYGASAPYPMRSPGEDRESLQPPLTGALSGNPVPFLSIQGLHKTYPGRNRRSPGLHAVKGISLDIAPGEFVGIVGESGSGKSTLAKLIMGLETPDGGAILLNGKPLGSSRQDNQRRILSIQMIFQDSRSALNPRRKVRSLLTQIMEARPDLASAVPRRAQELARDVGLAVDMLDSYPPQMSGGQRQRVNIGRALCELPQLLVADEIVSGLDVSVQAQILNLLLALRQEHKISLLLISHDLPVVRYLCSRIMVMHRGEVVEQGNTEEVLANPQHSYTRSLIRAVPPQDSSQPWPLEEQPI